ncbi:MAG TPA: ABATE domain-containing protein [Blastocatellia bacterium]|nr:ABATE domain-containing protein [Blastocatellia bacterium]
MKKDSNLDDATIEVLLVGPSFSLIGNCLCLDFANTADWHARARPVELLTDYFRLLSWAKQARILNQREALEMARWAKLRPSAARAALARAVSLRETVYRLFSAVAAGRQTLPDDLAAFNLRWCELSSRSELIRAGDRFKWHWTGDNKRLDSLLWPIAKSVAELLVSNELDRVRECQGEGCGWLFLDTSRNHLRVWCHMAACGNRAKARRFYERNKVQL